MSWINAYGIEVDPPYADAPPSEINHIRSTILFWNYMVLAGIPLKCIADCFGVHYTLVSKYLKEVPEDIKADYASDEFVGRLRAAFPEGRRPKSSSDVRRFLQAARSDDVQGRPSVPGV